MNDKNIFEEKVRIPDIVDSKVDQVLSDLPDHGTIREVAPKEKKSSGKTFTRVLAFAVAASVLLLSYTVYRAVRSGKEKKSPESLTSESTDLPNGTENPVGTNNTDNTDGTENTDGTISQKFTIMVAGQGLRDDRSIPLENKSSRFTNIAMHYFDFNFEFEFPLSVAGENVESVEYSFKNADVAIAHNGTSPSNITGEKIDLDDRYLSDWEDEPKRYYISSGIYGLGRVDFYHSYKESAISGETYTKYICVLLKDRRDLYEHLELEERDGNFMAYSCDVLTAMCKDIVVTVKVNFADGSSESIDIGIKGGEVPYTYSDEEGKDYTEMQPGFVCYIKGSSEEPGEVHLRSFEEEGLPPASFSDEEMGIEKDPDPEVLQEQERLKKLVEEKNILKAPDLKAIPNTFENGNGGLGRNGWDQGWNYVSFGLPFIADGEDIDHVEFRSLSEDLCFYDLYTVGDEEYRIKGTESSNGYGVNEAILAEDPEHPKKGERLYHCYSSFSMQYPVREMKNYELYVEIDVRGNETLKAMDTDVVTRKGYEDSDFYNTAFKDKTIEMTVYYKDGTSVTKKIAFALILEPDDEVPSYNMRNLYAYIVE